MTALIIHGWASNPVQTDELCPTCWLPSLWVFIMMLGNNLNTVTFCQDCGIQKDREQDE